jgi:spore coat polysaccharide biosynthesis protein SpsF|tara:strand:- start:924 stop:1997 length:1074 start_codon:yes stop_codon:yes gene_type:complete
MVIDKRMGENDARKILFRVDGGRIRGVSLGHVFRCMTLAGELKERYQFDVTFLMKNYEEGVKVVKRRGFEAKVLNCNIDHNQEIDIIERFNGNLIVFDVIDVMEKGIGRLLGNGKQIVAIDDTGNKRIDADVVINGSIVPEFRLYLKNGKNTCYYLGPKYCILGEEFDSFQSRETKPKVETVLVFMGGSDPVGLTLRVAKYFSASSFSHKLVIILGPGFEGQDKVKDCLRTYRGMYYLLEAPPKVFTKFAEADIAILAGGRTAYEAARMGVPSIIIPSIKHEEKVAKAFSDSGAFLALPLGESLPENKFCFLLHNAMEKLLENRHMREQMSKAAGKLVDGRGRNRVIHILLKSLKKR